MATTDTGIATSADFTSQLAGYVTIMNGTATFSLNIASDGIAEGDETIIMGISQTQGGSILATSPVVTIAANNT